MSSSTSVRGRHDLGNVLGRDVAVVDGDGKPLVLHTPPGIGSRSLRSSAAAVSKAGIAAAAASFWWYVPSGPMSSKPWPPAYQIPGRPTRSRMSARSRPLNIATGHSAAKRSKALAAPSTSVAASGSETISEASRRSRDRRTAPGQRRRPPADRRSSRRLEAAPRVCHPCGSRRGKDHRPRRRHRMPAAHRYGRCGPHRRRLQSRLCGPPSTAASVSTTRTDRFGFAASLRAISE